MKKLLIAALLGASMLATPAQALLIASGGGTVDTTDSSQLGRLNRNAVISTWASPKAYPGALNTSTTHYYELAAITFAANAMQDVFYRINFAPSSTNVHSAAYANSYNPLAKSTNYLGDVGSSTAQSYEVKVLAGNSLLLLFNTNGSTNSTNYSYSVEAFSDVNGGEVFGAVPEPATWAMMIGGFALIGSQMRRRRTVVSFA